MSLRILNAFTLFVVILSGLNWGLIGLFDFNVATAIFGDGTLEEDPAAIVTRILYVLVGLAALWQLIVLLRRLTPKD
jgi:uncharacterized membrane protein YuzA (DUF378 family)